jgi:nicotinamide mononucleotide transporter
MPLLEVAANAVNGVSVLLAGRNSIHTWWTGIIGCALFAVLFYRVQLYADATLQIFFVAAAVFGWIHWRRNGDAERERPVTHVSAKVVLLSTVLGGAVTLGYGLLLDRLTDAAAPLPDSAVLAFSVIGQVLLVGRRVETWWFWLLVNTIAVPLFAYRGLHLTSVLYAAFWVNALVSLRRWQQLAKAV